MPRVTRMNDVCHTYTASSVKSSIARCICVVAHVYMHTCIYVYMYIYIIWMTHVTRMNESCHIYEWHVSHIQRVISKAVKHQTHMRRGIRIHVYMYICIHVYIYISHEWLISHIWMMCVTHTARHQQSHQSSDAYESRNTYSCIHAYIYYVYTYISYEQHMLLIRMTQVTNMKDMCLTMGWLRLVDSLKT